MLVNGERALAYVVTVDEIQPLEGYDRVVYARTNGWWCIVGKDELKVGDKAVYFEVDSKVPADDKRFEFLEKRNYKIKTQKMCKVYSQGLLMPLTLFPELGDAPVGTDLTKKLRIVYADAEDNERKGCGDPNAKYKSMAARHQKLFKSKPVRWLMRRKWGKKLMFLFFGRKKDKPKGFPSFVAKTDEERCLTGNSKIFTSDGLLRIADIVNKEIHTNVLSLNEATGDYEFKPIVGYQKILIDGETLIDIGYPYRPGISKLNHITCTPDHKIYLDDGRCVPAGELKIGDKALMAAEVYDDSVIPIVCGMLLGDSSIQDDKRSHCKLRINTTHGEAQIDYLQYKQTILGCSHMYEMKSGYCDKNVYRIYTIADAKVDAFLRENCWINGRKTITKEFVDKLTPESLAIWYMDDGTLKHKYDTGNQPNIMISSNSFTKEENELLIDRLRNYFGVECNLSRDGDYCGIYITVEGTKKFLKLITPYIHPCLRYKTTEDLEDIPFIGISPIVRRTEAIPVEIKEIKAYNGSRHDRYVYDITVADNHNFFAQGILTHNCENQPWRVGDGKTYIATEKLDGTSCTYALKKLPKKTFSKQEYEFYVCSRNVRQKDEDQKCYHDHNIYWDLAFKYNIEEHLKQFLAERPDCTWVCIQGEGVGSVQGNPLKLKEDDLYVFNFITDVDGRWNSYDGKLLIERFGMKWVPILGEVTMPDTMEALKETADGKSVVNPSVDREGLVYRGMDGQDSFKNVSRKYLLKHQNA